MDEEAVTLTIPRSAIGDVITISEELLHRMHELLERNTDGSLSQIEQQELQTLVRIAEFGQLISSALLARAKP